MKAVESEKNATRKITVQWNSAIAGKDEQFILKFLVRDQ